MTYEAETWTLTPNQTIERKELQRIYGGRTQGGIGPSRKSPNVLLFSDPISGEQHGYFDGWMPDGCFHYTGEGQFGDQQMKSGNRSILDHRSEGRALRLFDGASGTVTYIDEFELDPAQPWYETDAPESGGKAVRKVIVFRLRPTTIDPQPSTSPLAPIAPDLSDDAVVTTVSVEEQHTERSYVDPSREPYEAERREAKLVLAYRDHLRGDSHQVSRLQIVPPGERKPIFSDLYDHTDDTIVEAKGTVTRGAIRTAIGQLADYGRFAPTASRAILVPERPRPDLLDLALSQNLTVIWPDDTGFAHASNS